MKHIAIIGECMIELNGKPFGEMMQTFGGDTLNAAVYLCRGKSLNREENDLKVSYVTAMGTDAISDGMLSRWRDEGIDTDLVLRDRERTPGLYLIQLDDSGERTFLYWRNQSAARYLVQHLEFDRIRENLARVDMILLSGISLAILPEEDRGTLLKLLGELKKQGVEIAFDSNFRPALWPTGDGLKTVKDCFLAMYNVSNLALVTFDDEQAIWGDATEKDTLRRLKESGVEKVVVKLGEDGCVVQEFATHADPIFVSTDAVKDVIDTTAAGDSFNGGFLSGYLVGASIEEACKRGNALARQVIQHKGAIIPAEVLGCE